MTHTAMRRGCGDAAAYEAMRAAALRLAIDHPNPSDRLQPLTDLFWDTLAGRGVSWVGFYLEDGEPSDEPMASDASKRSREDSCALSGADAGERRMILAARRDKPACSPIGMHGACGQAFLEERVRLIDDVALLGAGYIACDPRDRSEIVVPIYRNGAIWGVLDADSHEMGCFGEVDVAGLCGVLRAAGLLHRDLPTRADRLR